MFAYVVHPWFVYVLVPSAAAMALHLYWIDYWGPISRPHKLFYMHILCIYVPLNVVLFTIFVATAPGHPWFAYPLLLTAVPVVAHYIISFHSSPHKWFYIHVAEVSLISGFLFLVWYLTPASHPWFIYPWIAFSCGLLLHYSHEYHRHAIRNLIARAVGKAKAGVPQLPSLLLRRKKPAEEQEEEEPSQQSQTETEQEIELEPHQDTQIRPKPKAMAKETTTGTGPFPPTPSAPPQTEAVNSYFKSFDQTKRKNKDEEEFENIDIDQAETPSSHA